MDEEYNIGEICGQCESLKEYYRHEECDHSDFHVKSVTLSAEPCEPCHEVYHMWADTEDLLVDWEHVKHLIDLASTQGTVQPNQEI